MRGRRHPLAVWQRSVRRALRDYVKEHGTVPGLWCAVSEGDDPAVLRMDAALHILADGIQVKALVQERIRERGSSFVAWGKLLGSGFDRCMVVVAVSEFHDGQWAASVDAERGLGAWRKTSVLAPDGVDFARLVIEDVARARREAADG